MAEDGASAGGNTIRYTVLHDALASLPAEWHAALQAAVAQVAQTFYQGAQKAYQGTRFAQAFTVTSSVQPVIQVRLVQTHPLFPMVEYPTRAHVIEPRNARVLRFTINGRVVYARRVHHPGTKGRQVMDPLFQQAADAFGRALTEAGYKVLSRGL